MPGTGSNPRAPDDNSLFKGKSWFTRKVIDLIVRMTPTCPEMTRLISREMDGPLPLIDRVKMRVHYFACCYCENYKTNLHLISSVMGSADQHMEKLSDEELSSATKERIKQSLRDDSQV